MPNLIPAILSSETPRPVEEIASRSGPKRQNLLGWPQNPITNGVVVAIDDNQTRKTDSSTERFSIEDLQYLQSGDEGVFKRVYDAYFPLVLYVVKRCGLQGDESLDIVQETFTTLFHKASQIKNPGSIKSWLITTARNLTVDHLRKFSRIQLLNGEIPEIEEDSQSHRSFLYELEVQWIGRFIDSVCQELQDDTLKLFYQEGKNAREIAEQKSESISTVTNRLSRLRKRLKKEIQTQIKLLRDSVPL